MTNIKNVGVVGVVGVFPTAGRWLFLFFFAQK